MAILVMDMPQVSVIIPTYNRQQAIIRTLGSLAQQSISSTDIQVVVVDDGSSSSLKQLEELEFPFQLILIRQTNQGATRARNLGADHSNGQTIIFLDDDISLNLQALESLNRHCALEEKAIVIGTLIIPDEIINQSSFASIFKRPVATQDGYIHYTQCMTGLLAIRRDDFFSLGQFQDPTGGWPNWDDVDFGYRAHLQGYKLLKCTEAVGQHWDESLLSLESSYNRLWQASKSAARLFQVHPELKPEIRMFRDSLPIDPEQDSISLVIRKLVRKASSTSASLWVMERMVNWLEQIGSPLLLMRPLYRWILGGYIYRGYRAGEHELELVNSTDGDE